MRFVLAMLFCLICAGPALAQDRSPSQRQSLLDLSYALGQSHAYRQDCQGAGDQYWRGRMLRMVEAESADAAFEARMKNQFNAGFAAAQSAQLSCAASHAPAAQAARRAAAAAASLSRATLAPAPAPDDR